MKSLKKEDQELLEPGQNVTVSDLLRGIVQSGNDAAIVLAEGISGTEDIFQINELVARELGMNNTTFRNLTGWPDPEQNTKRSVNTFNKFD